jgi:hypothetical protein
MAKPPFDSRDGFFSIVGSNGTSTFTLAPGNLSSVDGLPGTKELIDTSKIGDSGRTFTRSLWNGTFVLEGFYDHTASTGAQVVLEGLLDMSSATTFQYGPTGNSTGQTPPSRKISGKCWIRSQNITGRVGNTITFRAEGQVEGTVDFGTFT